MRFDVFTLFPGYFDGPLSTSILKRGRESGAIEVQTHDIRDWTTDKHRMTDDYPFGGGAGMVMKAEPVARALEDVLNFEVGVSTPPCPVVFLTPQGRTLNQKIVEELAVMPQLALLCGHYEGIDERVIETCVTHEISLGDFVLTGGEGAAAILIEAVARFVPGVLGNENSATGDSFANGLLEAPHYTRPARWRGLDVPEVLLSGNHGKIGEWRFWESVRRTLRCRPELVEDALRERPLSRRETKIYEEIRREVRDNTLTEAKAKTAEPGQTSALENSEEEAS